CGTSSASWAWPSTRWSAPTAASEAMRSGNTSFARTWRRSALRRVVAPVEVQARGQPLASIPPAEQPVGPQHPRPAQPLEPARRHCYRHIEVGRHAKQPQSSAQLDALHDRLVGEAADGAQKVRPEELPLVAVGLAPAGTADVEPLDQPEGRRPAVEAVPQAP